MLKDLAISATTKMLASSDLLALTRENLSLAAVINRFIWQELSLEVDLSKQN